MARITDEVYAGEERDSWFKFLGRYLLESLKEDKAEELLLKIVTEGAATIGKAPLRGTQKVWILDNYIMSTIMSTMVISHSRCHSNLREAITIPCSEEVAQDLDRLLPNRKRVHLLPLQSSPWPTAKEDVLMAQTEPPDSP